MKNISSTRIATLLLIIIVFIGFRSNPPNGRTGAPGEGLCTSCHAGGNPNLGGEVLIAGIPGTIEPNTLYPITVTVTNTGSTSATRGGMQMVVLDSNDDNVGTLSNPGPNSDFQLGNGRNYFEHRNAINFNGESEVTYTCDWTSPASPDGEVIRFYASCVIANGNNQSSLDLVDSSQVATILDAGILPLMVNITESSDVSCNAGNDGTATALAEGGTQPYSYSWSSGEMNAMANMLTAGNQSVTVTDNDGNTASASVLIEEPNAIDMTIVSQTDVLCNGEMTGTATVNATGGTGNFSYNWGNGLMGATQNMLGADLYTVTATDQNDCTATIDVQIDEPELLSGTVLAQSDASCQGLSDGSATVLGVGGIPEYSYSWPSGNMTNSESGLSAGNYVVTIVDNNDCVATVTVSIGEPAILEALIVSMSDVSCNGEADGSATANGNGGTPPYSFIWSNMAETNSINNLEPGIYTVTVTDDNDCSATNSVEITEPDALTLALTAQTDILCNGDMNGSLTVQASGGTEPYNYMWEDGSTGPILENIGAGTYAVTATDANDCSVSISIEAEEPDAIIVNASATNETSPGAEDGTATADPSGGTEPYSYNWSNNETTQSIMNLGEGNYTVTVTDVNDCTQEQTVTVSSDACQLIVSVNPMNLSCFESGDGAISLMISGEVDPVSINWSNNESGLSIENLMAGTYGVTVTDGADCSFIDDAIIVGQPDQIEFNIEVVSTPECPDDQTGVLMASSSNNELTYEWSTGFIGATLENLGAGTYQVTATDASNCTRVDSIELQGEDDVPPVLMVNDLTVYVDGFGEVEDVLFEDFDNGSSDNCGPISLISNIPKLSCDNLGMVEVVMLTISDESGNETNGIVNITVLDTIPPSLDLANAVLHLDEDGNLPDLTVEQVIGNSSDNCMIAEVQLNVPEFDCSNIGENEIMVMVTDGSGNTSTANSLVTVLDTFPPEISCIMDITSNTCQALEYDLPSTDDNCNTSTPELIEGFASGEIFPVGETTVTYRTTDDAGNTAECSFVVTIISDLSVDILTEDASCFNFSDGRATVTVSGGAAPYSIDSDPDGIDFELLSAGRYYLTITDSENCSLQDSFDIMEPDVLFITDAEVVDESPAMNDGSISIDITGGVEPYDFEWTKDGEVFSTDEDLSELDAGVYQCTIIDANGCLFLSDQYTVNFNTGIIDQMLDRSIRVMPNPNEGCFLIRISNSPIDNANIEILDLTGKVVHKRNNVKMENTDVGFDLFLEPSVYYIKVYDNDSFAVKKVVVQ